MVFFFFLRLFASGRGAGGSCFFVFFDVCIWEVWVAYGFFFSIWERCGWLIVFFFSKLLSSRGVGGLEHIPVE